MLIHPIKLQLDDLPCLNQPLPLIVHLTNLLIDQGFLSINQVPFIKHHSNFSFVPKYLLIYPTHGLLMFFDQLKHEVFDCLIQNVINLLQVYQYNYPFLIILLLIASLYLKHLVILWIVERTITLCLLNSFQDHKLSYSI
jgi:hypothetical protein